MRALICGGGTAGHVMPAIAIAEIIEKSFPGSVIAFAGRSGGAENEAYLKTKHRLYTVDICGLNRSISLNSVKSVYKIIKSSRNARSIIDNFNPDLIIGTGGYVCYPFIRQGQLMNIKTVIHESNASPGLVTRTLGGRCDTLLVNLEGTKACLRKTDNVITVGNPTRKDFGTLTKSEAKRRLRIPDGQKLIVSFGGSLGAEVLNESIGEFISRYVLHNTGICHIHATGKKHYSEMQDKYPALFKKTQNILIIPYIDDMPTVLNAADLAITRSGAITISELARCGTPSILIPSPNVTGNHQHINAEYMRSLGAAVLIEEKNLCAEGLQMAVQNILDSQDNIRKMSASAKQAYTKNTDILIRNAIAELINR